MWGVRPFVKNLVDRRQPEASSEAVDLRREHFVQHEDIEQAKYPMLEERRHPVGQQWKLMHASKSSGLQVNRNKRKPQLLMRDVRSEELSLGDKDCLEWIKARNDPIEWLQDWEHHALRKDSESLFGIPKIRVLDDGLIIFGTAEAQELDTHGTRLSLEELAGDQSHTVTALP